MTSPSSAVPAPDELAGFEPISKGRQGERLAFATLGLAHVSLSQLAGRAIGDQAEFLVDRVGGRIAVRTVEDGYRKYRGSFGVGKVLAIVKDLGYGPGRYAAEIVRPGLVIVDLTKPLL